MAEEAAAAAARAVRERVLASQPQTDAVVRAPCPRERGRSMALEAQSMAAQRASVAAQVNSLEASSARRGSGSRRAEFDEDDDSDDDDMANATVEVI